MLRISLLAFAVAVAALAFVIPAHGDTLGYQGPNFLVTLAEGPCESEKLKSEFALYGLEHPKVGVVKVGARNVAACWDELDSDDILVLDTVGHSGTISKRDFKRIRGS